MSDASQSATSTRLGRQEVVAPSDFEESGVMGEDATVKGQQRGMETGRLSRG